MEVKITLSLLVPGAGLLTPEFCEKNPKESYNTTVIPVEYTVGRGKNTKVKKDNIAVKTRKSREVKHNLNISSEAYYHMISSSEPPTPKYSKAVGTRSDGTPITLWSTMKPEERLKVHLDLIAEHFNASGYTYEVLDD